MAGRTRLRAEDRVLRIVEEASQLISVKGYFGFSIGELAKRCDLSNAGLIHHIGSKDRVLQMVLDARDDRDLAVMETAGGGIDMAAVEAGHVGVPVATAVTMLHALVEHNETQPTIVRLYAILRNEALSAEHPSYEYFVARDAWSLRIFQGMFATATPRAAALSRQILALMGGLEEQWLREPSLGLVGLWDEAISDLLAGHGVRVDHAD